MNLGPTTLLHCRGGAGYEFKSLGFKSLTGGAIRVAMAMTFAPSPGAAGSDNQNLQPGTCALSDRPLAASEPREMHFLTDAFNQLLPGPIDISKSAAEQRPDARSMIDYLKDPAHYWIFHAVDTHAGHFDAVVHEYWTDRTAPPHTQPVIPPTPIARWLVRVLMTGGMAGSRREVSVNGDGRVQASGTGMFGEVQCVATISRSSVQAIEAALARARAESWPKAYPLKGNGCCDQIQTSIHLDQEDARGARASHETSWMSENANVVPEGVSGLFTIVYEARHACVF